MITKQCLRPDEAFQVASLKDGARWAFIRLLKEQPPEGYELSLLTPAINLKHCKAYEFIEEIANTTPRFNLWHIDCPYQPGTIGLRVTWGITWVYKNDSFNGLPYHGYRWEYIYKADYPQNEYGNHKWETPATMPADAIRSWLDIDKIGCKRVQELSTKIRLNILNSMADFSKEPEYALPSYIDSRFVTHWNDNHAKPIESGDGYVCYPWDRLSFTQLKDFHKYHENLDIEKGDKLGYYDTWKGKPLTIIHANPYVWIPEGIKHGRET